MFSTGDAVASTLFRYLGGAHHRVPETKVESSHKKHKEKTKTQNFSQILNEKIQASIKPKPIDDLSKLPEDFNSFIEKVSTEHGVNSDLIRCIIKKESRFNPSVRSYRGASGLMQLMPSTARSLGVKNLHDPYQNVQGGVKYISKLIKRFDGNIPKALAAYNAGPRNVEKYGGVPPFKETQNYINDILTDYIDRTGGNITGFAT